MASPFFRCEVCEEKPPFLDIKFSNFWKKCRLF
jgi:hypothetical protein